MKANRLYIAAAAAMTLSLAACDDEKDLVVIEGNLPIKTSSLFMVGDATPNGWDIGSPTPLEQSADDALVFVWEGKLNTGEIKLCLTPGSWDAPFVRPMENGTEIGSEAIVDAPFQMHAGDPDEKWRVTTAGNYKLSFDMRNWCMSTSYLGAAVEPEPVREPIEAENLYMLGDATPGGWSQDDAAEFTKLSKYVFEWKGALVKGNMKACIVKDPSWGQNFLRPAVNGTEINQSGVADGKFVFTKNPDDQWTITQAGDYTITFDLEKYTITVKGDGAAEEPEQPQLKPIEAEHVYMLGDATPGGWSQDDAAEFTKLSQYVFEWKGTLVSGEMKACIEKDPGWGQNFLRPAVNGTEINKKGIADNKLVFTKDPDDKWKVTEAGEYTITFDLEHHTITVIGEESPEPEVPGALNADVIYMVGEAAPGGWSQDDAAEFKKLSRYVFEWTGELKTGEMKACLEKDPNWGQNWLRPAVNGTVIDAKGVADEKVVFVKDPDDKWNVTEAGKYRLTFDLAKMTLKAEKL